MAFKQFVTLALLATGAYAQASVAGDELPILNEADAAARLSDTTSPPTVLDALKVTASVSFPDASVLGIKLINGVKTTALFKVRNDEADPIKVRMIGGSLWSLGAADLKKTEAVRNLSSTQFQHEVKAGEEATLTYQFKTELHPQDLRLLVAGLFEDKNRNAFQLEGFNGTVSIVEAPVSIFDPQILFLYAFLTALFLATLYLIYTTWLAPYLPNTKTRKPRSSTASGSGSGSSRSRPAYKSAPSAASVPLPSDDSDSATAAAAATGASGYDESWIDKRHLERPSAKRVRSGAAAGRARAK